MKQPITDSHIFVVGQGKVITEGKSICPDYIRIEMTKDEALSMMSDILKQCVWEESVSFGFFGEMAKYDEE